MLERTSTQHPRLFSIVKHGAFPVALYFTAFCLLTFPLMGKFFTGFFGGIGDGLQNVWNIWWVNEAVRRPDLYPTIWYTRMIQWPTGTSLVGHTLNPFNGFLGAFLLTFLPLTATYNTIVVFAFVATGVTMYWLAYYLTRSYWASLLAGFLLTFSNYHFGHYSQLQTASLEWIPLFLLCWYVLLTAPRPLLGAATALVLWLVLLCDYYYFTYCILAAILIFLWYAATCARSLRFIARREHLVPLLLFAGAALVLAAPQVGSLLLSNHYDPLRGAHDPARYSLDLLGLLLPGGFWLFSHWTQAYWMRLPGNITENSTVLAAPVFVLLGYLWIKRRRLDPALKQQLYLWSSIIVVFFLLALGPVLRVAGAPLWSSKLMPYTLLGHALPFLAMSGVPARMSAMVVLGTAILSAFALRELWRRFPRRQLLTLGLLGIIVFEALPAPIVTTTIQVPDYVKVLAGLPNDGGVLDLLKTGAGFQLYYQTIHDKPISFGYLARLPSSVFIDDGELATAFGAHDYAQLWGLYHIRYVLTPDALPRRADQPYMLLTLLYDKDGTMIYRLSCACELGR